MRTGTETEQQCDYACAESNQQVTDVEESERWAFLNQNVAGDASAERCDHG
jgi:hypothetical protein